MRALLKDLERRRLAMIGDAAIVSPGLLDKVNAIGLWPLRP
jgi:hypothetical protein